MNLEVYRRTPVFALELRDAFNDRFDLARRGVLVKNVLAEAKVKGQAVEQYSLQHKIRPLFGKGEPKTTTIGPHPDFLHLQGTEDTAFAPIVTMFMDMESSTRLSLFYKPQEVFWIKNAFIGAAIEVVSAFDGHVHRLMGDGVMAFFGGRETATETAVVDALNCASVLQFFVEESVRPQLQRKGDRNEPFGIRIGLDYGPHDEVLWSSYGYPGTEEVTATSFFVDGAAKLQQAARRNGVMLGDSLVSHLDFPRELLTVPTKQKDGKTVERPHLMPNYTDNAGNPINYRQHLLQWKEYLLATALGQMPLAQTGSTTPILVTAAVAGDRSGVSLAPYLPASVVLAKGKEIQFRPDFSYIPPKGTVVKFIVENHGREAEAAGDMGGPRDSHTINSAAEAEALVHWESTKYRGLHYMTVEVKCDGLLRHRTRIGVYIE